MSVSFLTILGVAGKSSVGGWREGVGYLQSHSLAYGL